VRTLQLKVLRDLWRVRWRAVALVLSVACGVAVFSGIEMAAGSLVHTAEVLLARMRFADLEVQFLPEDTANLPDLSAIPGVQAVERRLIFPGTVFLEGDRRIVGLLVFLETPAPNINALERLHGRSIRPDDFDSVVIERSLAIYHGFNVGDRISVKVGAKTYESRIDGVVLSPEYLTAAANPDYVIPEKGALGVVFGNLARVSDALGFTMVNDLLFRFDPGSDRDAVKAAVLARLQALNLERVMARDEHFVWRHLQTDIEAFRIYTPSIVVILAVLAFVLTLITVNRLVLDQRKEIGGLLALGYHRRQVLGAYLMAATVVGVVGAVVGTGLAFPVRNGFASTYAGAHGMPAVIPVIDLMLLATGFAAGVLIPAAATALPVLRMLRLSPQAIIREPVYESAATRAWIRWAFARMGALPPAVRFGTRNMFRRPGRTVAAVLAMAASLGVAMAYTVAMRSAFETIEIAFEGERWDLAVDFLYPVFLDDLESIRAMPGVVRVEPYFRRFVEVGANARFENATIVGIDPGTAMRRTVIRAGRFLGGAPDEALLSHDLARRLRVGVGDPVTIRVRQGEEHRFRVVGISGEVVPAQVTLPFRQAQVIANFKDEATGVYVDTSGVARELALALPSLEYVAKVTDKAHLLAAFRRLMSEMMRLVYLATAISVFVAMLFIFMSVNLAVTERQPEYATFKCLGYDWRRLRAMILTEAFGEGALAAILSVPVGLGLAAFLNSRLSAAWYEVMNIFHPGDVAVVLAVAMLLIPVAAFPGLRIVRRLDIVTALRTRILE
jgi:putative ABC transport system permease protein